MNPDGRTVLLLALALALRYGDNDLLAAVLTLLRDHASSTVDTVH